MAEDYSHDLPSSRANRNDVCGLLARISMVPSGIDRSTQTQTVQRIILWENHMSRREHQSCIEACIQCAQACEHCADACLSEKDVTMMANCIRLDRDCAELCLGVVALMSRCSQFAQQLCTVCAEICEACGVECRRHKMDHCQKCADACETCSEECRRMSGAMT